MKTEQAIAHSSDINSILAFLEDSRDGVFLISDNMTIHYTNETMQDWMSVHPLATQNSILLNLIGRRDSIGTFTRSCHTALAGTPVKFECLIHPPQSLSRWLEISIHKVSEAQILGIARDITLHKQEIERLNLQFSQDELTGLMNRNAFTHILQDSSKPLPGHDQALLLVDLTHFNIINDTCGHAAGDDLLRQIAGLIQSSLGENDVLARIGGDEFAMLCVDCNLDQAYAKACEIRGNITDFKFDCDNKKFEIGASIGIAPICHDTDNSKHTALSEANSACHYARNLGYNRIHVFSPNGHYSYRQQEAEWISRIAQAFEDNRFKLFYQNIHLVNTGNDRDDHHEILIRMQDENGNYITPDEFLPAAEKYNLMPLIDRWVIRTLFARNAALWRNAFDVQLSDTKWPMSLCCINISGASLNDDYFPEFLRDQIALHKVPPQAVCFEITETVAINNLAKASTLINELRSDGFRFALDDFGKGMSSFSYLKSLPVDFLKIDGALVENIDIDKTDLCMVEAIHKIAQEMGIKTIAEFVKNQTVIDMLQVIGVDYAQGFGIHRPEPLH